MEIRKIQELADILCQNQLTKLELTEGECCLVLEKTGVPSTVKISEETTAKPVAVLKKETEEKREEKTYLEQKSPLVGTAYLAPQAGAEAFVKVGDRVQKGDVLCIVESMKMFNQIEAEHAGIVEAVCVDNGQVVEYGQTLFRIKGE